MSLKIALAGNPNCGKTTMFNNLTASSQYVGNWPGVTVEKKEGKYKRNKNIIIQDLPGIYSLSPYTQEEVVARNYLVKDKPDVIINIIDGTNLERNLYLTIQLLELGIPMVIAMNMIDVVRKNGDKIDIDKLSAELGCKIIETSALKGEGLDKIVNEAIQVADKDAKEVKVYYGLVEMALNKIEEVIRPKLGNKFLFWSSIKVFEKDEKVISEIELSSIVLKELNKLIEECERQMNDTSESIITDQRYNYIAKIVKKVMKKKEYGKLKTTDKIDRVVTNRILALPIFIIIMFGVYYVSVTTIGSIVTDWTNDTLFGSLIIDNLTNWFINIGVSPWLNSLITNGIIGGVGAVLGFVPQLIVLFILLSILEDVGYLSRVAFIMDKIFRRFGLSGKSFIPLLIGSGCSIPGIMASRTIENEKDRRITIMTTSFIPCGAKMPIIALFAGVMFNNAWYVGPLAYFIGVLSVIISGVVLKKTKMFAGEVAPFVMELPNYHIPGFKNLLSNTWERVSSFIKKAGTIILLANIIIWFFSSFGFVKGSFRMVDNIEISLLANIGNLLRWIFIPIGFGSWKATVATVMGLVAKEEVVGVLGVLYHVSNTALDVVDSGNFSLLGGISQFFTPSQAWSFILFNLLSIPCFAAVGTIRREMNSKKWSWFSIGYLVVFSYSWCFIFYQLALFFTLGAFTFLTVFAIIIFSVWIYLIFRKNKYLEVVK